MPNVLLQLTHAGTEFAFEMGTPIRAVLGSWADYQERIWVFTELLPSIALKADGTYELMFQTGVRENAYGQEDHEFEAGDVCFIEDVEFFMPHADQMGPAVPWDLIDWSLLSEAREAKYGPVGRVMADWEIKKAIEAQEAA